MYWRGSSSAKNVLRCAGGRHRRGRRAWQQRIQRISDLKRYNDEPNAETKRLVRNEILDERVLEIDHQFREFEDGLWQQGVGAGVGTDWVLLAITAATATVGGEAVKSLLGVSATAITGGKASFDKNAFIDKAMPAVVAQMVAEREKIRADLEHNKQLPVANYTLYAGLSDFRRFQRAGTIPGGIQVVAEDAGAKASTATQEIKNVRTARFVKDDAGDKLRAFWKPDGLTIAPANEARLKQWVAQHGLATGPGDITLFLRDEAMADMRARRPGARAITHRRGRRSMAKVKEPTNVPEADMKQVEADFKSEGCTEVKSEKQADGRWTIRATCPD